MPLIPKQVQVAVGFGVGTGEVEISVAIEIGRGDAVGIRVVVQQPLFGEPQRPGFDGHGWLGIGGGLAAGTSKSWSTWA